MKQKSAAHQSLIQEAQKAGVILPERYRTQKALSRAIEVKTRQNERDEARAEISRRIMPI